jgi:hypothetical protein
MTDQQQPPAAAAPERCLCRQAIELWSDMFGVRSDAARQHLRNSRIEFLKAIRSVLDERIDSLSRAGQPEQGRTIPVD